MLGPRLSSDPRLIKHGYKNAQLTMTGGRTWMHQDESSDRNFLACLHSGASLCTADPAFSSSSGTLAGSLPRKKKPTTSFQTAPVFGLKKKWPSVICEDKTDRSRSTNVAARTITRVTFM